ncbi:hypothetical protein [Streptomyces alboflavus]|uniref:hypothetical protein n=1 Tax=Streptomyces alboflavus TaxID=67267 RepID=UPI001F32F485|nr:hypothetical protein [Streptomyces alboflavus]
MDRGRGGGTRGLRPRHPAHPRAAPHARAQSRGELARAHPRTRWTTDAAPGVFLAYGAQILHGVTPVRSGTLRKFVADLVDATD